jgi:hypothetical protein
VRSAEPPTESLAAESTDKGNAAAGGSQPSPTSSGESSLEVPCSWYGARGGDVLFTGESAFWSAMSQRGGDPAADLLEPGPRQIGRFDLATEEWLEPLAAGPTDAASGVWDVLVHPDGRIWFTTFFELSGAVDPSSGEVSFFASAGRGLNELAPAERGRVIATRYAPIRGNDGSLVLLASDGRVLAEHALAPKGAGMIAPKTPAWDPVRREYWTTSDRIPEGDGPPGMRRPGIVLRENGSERIRYERDELQFVAFGKDGGGFVALVDEAGSLWLVYLAPSDRSRDLSTAPRVLLDAKFAGSVDFVQDLQLDGSDRVVATRWSGIVHVVDVAPDGKPRETARIELPRRSPGGLFYTAVVRGDRVCASYCAGVRVECAALPSHGAQHP